MYIILPAGENTQSDAYGCLLKMDVNGKVTPQQYDKRDDFSVVHYPYRTM